MFARYQDILAGGVDEEGSDINNVAKALDRVGVSIRDVDGGFRDFSDVLDDVYSVWQDLDEIEQANILKALAGVRQRESLLVLLENETKYRKALVEVQNAEGLAAERYAIYLEGVEAAQNRVTASWEKLYQSATTRETIAGFYNATAVILEFIDKLGGIPNIIQIIIGSLVAMKIATVATTVATEGLSVAFTALNLTNPVGWVTLLVGAIIAVANAIPTTEEKIASLNSELEKQNEIINNLSKDSVKIKELSERYKKLAEEEKGLKEHSQEYWGVSNQLKQLIPELSGGFDVYGNFLIDASVSMDELNKSTIEQIELQKKLKQEIADEKSKLVAEALLSSSKKREQANLDKSKTISGGYRVGLSEKEVIEINLDFQEAEKQAKQAFMEMSDDAKKVFIETLQEGGEEGKRLADEYIQYLKANLESQIKTFRQGEKDYAPGVEKADTTQFDFVKNLQAISQNLTGDSKTAFDAFASSVAGVTQEFQNGQISATEYFDILNQQLEGANFSEMFSQDENAAQSFFAGLVANSTQAMYSIVSDFEAGKLGVVELIQQLDGLGGVFETINAIVTSSGEAFGLSSEQISEFSTSTENALSSISELTGMFDLVDMTVAGMSQSLAFNSEEFNIWARNVADAMFAVGGTWTDATGNILKSADDIYNYATSSAGNMTVLVNQMSARLNGIIKTATANIANMLRNLGEMIGSFKGQIYITPKYMGESQFSANLLGINVPFTLPAMSLDISSNFQGVKDFINRGASAIENWGASNPIDLGDFIKPGGIGATTGAVDKLNKALGGTRGAAKDASKSVEDLKKSLDDAKKSAIESLKEQLKGYKDVIDARKKLLDSMEKERKYQQDLDAQNNNILRIQNEMAALQFDTSQEGQARLLQLQEELKKAQQNLENTQFSHSIDAQKDALDAEYKSFETVINNAIKQVQGISASSLQDFARQLSVILQSIALPGANGGTATPLQTFHSGAERGVVGQGSGSFKSGEIFAKLMSGEVVVNASQIDNFFKNTIPQMLQGGVGSGIGDINIEMPLQVMGNLDRSVLPDIEKIVESAVKKLNDNLANRGYIRRADSYSL